MPAIAIQGHRGARGSIPENTFSSFEFAMDHMVNSIETDLHLTADKKVILYHDSTVGDLGLHISSFQLDPLRKYYLSDKLQTKSFPKQKLDIGPVARLFCESRNFHVWSIPTLAEMFEFIHAYSTNLGTLAGKSQRQQIHAKEMTLDLEIKQLPFRLCKTEILLEEIALLANKLGWLQKISIRSFDHQVIQKCKEIIPEAKRGLLFDGTLVANPLKEIEFCEANFICPRWDTLEMETVNTVQSSGIEIIPWTVNFQEQWALMKSLGIRNITTDYPKEFAEWQARQPG